MPRIRRYLYNFGTTPAAVQALVILLLVLSAGLIGNRIFVDYDEAYGRLDRHFIETTDNASRAVIASLSGFSRYVVHESIATPGILEAIHEGILTGELERTRAMLLEELTPIYEGLTEFQFRQLHFHLPDGRSLLRLHAPAKWGDPLFDVRESIRIVNEERRPISGFEAGRILTGYRFVYPLAHQGTPIGSVELSISFATVASALLNEFGRSGELLIDREVLDAILFEDERAQYGRTPLSPNHLVDLEAVKASEPGWVDRVRRELGHRDVLEGSADRDLVVPVTLDRVGYVAVLLSVEDISGDHVGYFVTYEQNDEYRNLLAETVERAILIALAVGAVLLVVLLANRARELAVAANKAKGQFLANVSHELRTPMSGVMGMVEALEREGTTDEQRAEYTRLLRSAGNDMVHIVNSILDMSRIEAGRVELHREAFSAAKIVEDLVNSMRTSEVAQGLQLRFAADDEANRYLVGDPLRVRQIVMNCLHNALKFTREGGVTVGVSAQLLEHGAVNLEITITDTGIGIPESQLPVLFEKFSQGTSVITQTYGGSGLGLSIVKSLVDLMKGKIKVRSMDGVGTTVYVRLPLELATEQPPEARVETQTETYTGAIDPRPVAMQAGTPDPGSSNETARSTTPTGGVDPNLAPVKLRILLAEDDLVSRHVAVALLARHGMEVVTASTGRRAFEIGRDGGFDVVLMDRRMPEMDGIEATQRLIDHWHAHGIPPVPIIGVSGMVSEDDRAECLRAGMSGFVSKPIRVDQLLGEIRRETPQSPPIDLARTQQTLGDTNELIDEILPIFLQQTGERLYEIDRAFEAKEHLRIHEQTHPLKTAALYLGAEELSTAARTIDDACRNTEPPDWEAIAPLVQDLRDQVNRIERWRAAYATSR